MLLLNCDHNWVFLKCNVNIQLIVLKCVRDIPLKTRIPPKGLNSIMNSRMICFKKYLKMVSGPIKSKTSVVGFCIVLLFD